MAKEYKDLIKLKEDMQAQMERDVNKMAKACDYSVMYGIPAGKTNDDGISISSYAKTVDYGSFSKNIPARPWLSTTKFRYADKIYRDLKNAFDKIKNESSKEEKPQKLRQIIEKYVCFPLINYMKDNILDGDWLPNSEKTIKEKGSDRPLIDKAQMLANVNSFTRKKDKK